ncbi:MAG: hypothetical protein JXA81_15210 [Sedimentisphaerales bacterium]|nr:hypothetical protein [Sedimentisphaerales bacterium]
MAKLRKPQLERELELEGAMLEDGREALCKQRQNLIDKGMAHVLPVIQRLIDDVFDPVRQGFMEYLQPNTHSKRGPKPEAFKCLYGCAADPLVYIALRTVFNMVVVKQDDDEGDTEGPSWQNVAIAIGAEFEVEAKLTKFKNKEQKTVEKIYRHHKGEKWKLRYELNKAMKKAAIDWTKWTKEKKFHCGAVLLDIILKTPLFETTESKPRIKKHRPMDIIQLSDDTKVDIIKWLLWTDCFTPKYRPMVYQPHNWTRVDDGGYLMLQMQTTIVKARHEDQLEGVSAAKIPEVFRSINAIQNTPWRINRKLLAVMKRVWRLPDLRQQPERMKKLFNIDDLKNKNQEIQMVLYLDEATEFAKEVRFWLPVSMDFRGRVYYQPYLNPQARDSVRALLEFANGKCFEGNPMALLEYGASLYNPGPLSYEDRQQWAFDNADDIRRSAKNPLQYRWWENADKPWQFLRWCMECESWLPDKWGPSFELYWQLEGSHLPIYADFTCNGLQHLCALLRDETGGAPVNLEPSIKPRDVYNDVANDIKQKLASSTSKHAVYWQKRNLKIDRDFVKPLVMTVPYGISDQGFLKHLSRAARKQVKPDEDFYKAKTWLKDIAWESVGKVINCMPLVRYLQDVANRISDENLHCEWTTPTGFVVRQRYLKQKSPQITTCLGDSFIRRRINFPTDKIDKRNAWEGITANLIHSLDAATLHKTICLCLDETSGETPHYKTTHFSVVHDAYAVHAANMQILLKAANIAFREIHSPNLIAKYHGDFSKMLPENSDPLPEPPPRGDLDISRFIAADYGFM